MEKLVAGIFAANSVYVATRCNTVEKLTYRDWLSAQSTPVLSNLERRMPFIGAQQSYLQYETFCDLLWRNVMMFLSHNCHKIVTGNESVPLRIGMGAHIHFSGDRACGPLGYFYSIVCLHTQHIRYPNCCGIYSAIHVCLASNSMCVYVCVMSVVCKVAVI